MIYAQNVAKTARMARAEIERHLLDVPLPFFRTGGKMETRKGKARAPRGEPEDNK